MPTPAGPVRHFNATSVGLRLGSHRRERSCLPRSEEVHPRSEKWERQGSHSSAPAWVPPGANGTLHFPECTALGRGSVPGEHSGVPEREAGGGFSIPLRLLSNSAPLLPPSQLLPALLNCFPSLAKVSTHFQKANSGNEVLGRSHALSPQRRYLSMLLTPGHLLTSRQVQPRTPIISTTTVLTPSLFLVWTGTQLFNWLPV